MALNLLQKQTECLNRMLNPKGNANKEFSYKILIYDEFCKNILALLFHVKDLLKQRVTLRLLIDKIDKDRKVENEGKTNPETESYLMLDPRALKPGSSTGSSGHVKLERKFLLLLSSGQKRLGMAGNADTSMAALVGVKISHDCSEEDARKELKLQLEVANPGVDTLAGTNKNQDSLVIEDGVYTWKTLQHIEMVITDVLESLLRRVTAAESEKRLLKRRR
ncbi:Sec1-like superfamily [Arabidopsis suecica]|uniref:Sec1-like superfamily n=1 Tax=Arabidopsis suecica TaxID=45249 RepID=A0A8T1YFN1_ARASU|nr:Sec1-like superfamily [Arabidopsis suecica]